MREVKQFQAFIEIVEQGSLTKAAARLHVTPSAISMNLAELERRLRVRLLNRNARQVALTSEGRQLYALVKPALGQLSSALNLFDNEDSAPAGKVKISIVTSFGKSVIVPALPEFLKTYPDIQLEINFSDVTPDLVREGFDVVLRHGLPDNSQHMVRRICQQEYILVASPAYIDRYGTPATPDDLLNHECISTWRSPGKRAPWYCVSANGDDSNRPLMIIPKGAIVVSGELDAIINILLAGVGISCVDNIAALPYLRSGALKRILPDYQVAGAGTIENIYIMFERRDPVPKHIRTIIDFIVEVSSMTIL